MENTPINRMMYLPLNIVLNISFSFFWERIRLSLNTIHTAKRVIKMPWPRSPNITANRKGKVMMVYGAGFISR